MSSYGDFQVDIRVPNAFGSFEATLGVMGTDVLLLFVFIICTWKLSCKDVAKPFLCLLSLCMLVSTMGTIALFVFKMYKMADEAAAYASIVRIVGRFASVNCLLFGGGYYLLGTGNSVRTRAPSACCSSWFLHFVIVAFSAIVGLSTIYCSAHLEHVPLFLFKTLPTFGCIFLLFGLVMGFLLSCCGSSDKVESEEVFLVDAKSRFGQSILFFIAPVSMVVQTRALDGGNLIYWYMLKYNPAHFYWNRYRVAELAATPPMIPGSADIEMFFTIAVTLSALVFLKFCFSAKTTKIAPVDASLPSFAAAHPMMMTPMMMPHPQMSFPVHQIALPPPAPATPLPALNQYTIMNGMGGRPAYMMV